MSRIQHIIFTEASLEHALSAVRALHDMSTELIAADVFRQMSELATYRLTPATIWCGPGGLYQSKLDAIANGEQQIAPAILIGTPDELIDDAHFERNRALTESERLQGLLDERCAQMAERDALLSDISKRHWSGVDFDLPTDLVTRIAALSVSAEPSAPAVPDEQREPI
ncbi:hypothetical protein [Pseudomonas putida]|uniref:hypothetical protein n=1 Tax=Pseudomonas putida TaxID=303 RepID=UPI0039E10368